MSMFHTSEPPPNEIAIAPWGEGDNPFRGGLPSWMAPKPDEAGEADTPSHHPSRMPSLPPSAPVSLSVHPATIPPPIRDYEGEIAALQAQLEGCVRAMTCMRRHVLEASERQLVELSVAVAERIVGREVTTDPSVVLGWAREGIAALSEQDALVLTVSSDLAGAVGEVADWTQDEQVEVRIGGSLEPATCEVRSDMGRVDASVLARLRGMRASLGIAEEGSS